ncbi:hypothetical protein [uncultured Erythrobacter sp.]|uniref:Abi-alpha family protein n=1 Tax=uncultured Erythrobacter sp. TaxID=263913 RepID=UPI002616C54B|nr:hypothetical protein [uncultured Erythrobacter sp.]
MAEPIITSGAVLVGTAAWFANRIFGPSADVVGDSLKAYLQSRVPAIFDVASKMAEQRNVEIAPIKPGLLARLVMDASFSDDAEDITRWWANLFIDASQFGSNIHAVYSDMMALIGPDEAKALDEFVRAFENGKFPASISFSGADGAGIDLMRDDWLRKKLGQPPFAKSRIEALERAMDVGDLPWPIRYTSWRIPVQGAKETTYWEGKTNPWYSENRNALVILSRAGILRDGLVQRSVFGGDYTIRTVELTPLGMDFYNACNPEVIEP